MRSRLERQAHLASRSWGVVIVAPIACATVWAAGCADDVVPIGPFDEDADAPQADADPPARDASDGSAPLDCATDLAADGVWRHLECSGLYSDVGGKVVAPDVRPYKPGVEFWSDGAEKHRWIYLPPGSTIDISDFDEWLFPAGTKLWKEFKLGGKRIETRFYVKREDGSWGHTTYRWNDDESATTRKDGGESLPNLGPDGGAYEIPSTGECDTCHFGKKDQVLGFEAVSLGLATATGETLAKLADEGRLSATPPKTTLELPGDETASSALAWLHVNCGSCHNANTNAAASFRQPLMVKASELAPPDGGAPKAVEELDLWTYSYCVDSFRTDPETTTAYKYIQGGNSAKSITTILAGARVAPGELPNPGVQMPPIVSRAVDTQGIALLHAWIETLAPCD